jgi:hypothetical protein
MPKEDKEVISNLAMGWSLDEEHRHSTNQRWEGYLADCNLLNFSRLCLTDLYPS